MVNSLPDDRAPKTISVLTSAGFLIALAILLLNDFYLKLVFGNFLTGKLSDFAGLAAFAIFLSAFLPARAGLLHIVVAIAFTFWKSPASEGVIEFVNSILPFRLGRTVDYTDLVALSILPFSFFYLRGVRPYDGASFRRVLASVSLIVAVFAFSATSWVRDRTLIFSDVRYAVKEDISDIRLALGANLLIEGLDITEVKSNRNFDVSDPLSNRGHLVSLTIAEPTCDSAKTKYRFTILETKNRTHLVLDNAYYQCRPYERANQNEARKLDLTYLDRAKEIFHRNVVSHLTEIKLNDTTASPRP